MKIKLEDLDIARKKELQILLNVEPDGIIGPITKKAFADWKKSVWLNDYDYISDDSFNLLRRERERNFSPAINIIKEFEGFSLTAYKDAIHGWKVPTIGYGTTIYSNGKRVKRGDYIDILTAEKELSNYINSKIIPVLERTIPYWNIMNNNQRSALISFAYNVGEHFYGNKNFKTISNVLKNKEWDKVPKALLLYRNPGTPAEQGLKRRRIAEGNLFTT